MTQAIVIVPKATLYENITMKNNCICAQNISDELLSGWLVSIQECQGNYYKIITDLFCLCFRLFFHRKSINFEQQFSTII